ncbi:MAG: copper chaperone PCu(A)C [Rhodospirillum sp.]|nr:copper chaperone PCu(A)C [Rhodospirillum sp.]MCF8491972.1 copper chaperone PCu(A)C [Rhodospirillum sp.]MCF8501314.1 copper chaperone PCu(A)C [Rhodospirillum sp.]
MTRRTVTAALAAASLSLSALTLSTTSAWTHEGHAHAEAQAGDITVTEAWARASAGMAKAGGGFLTLSNTGSTDDRLVAAKSDVSTITELHTHIREGDVMRMRPVEAIDVPAGGRVSLQPGGLHVMFIDLKAPLKEGDHFPLTLVFEKSGETTVDVVVKDVGAMGMGMSHGAMQNGQMNQGTMPGMGNKPAN